jgi:hypothetical protein
MDKTGGNVRIRDSHVDSGMVLVAQLTLPVAAISARRDACHLPTLALIRACIIG